MARDRSLQRLRTEQPPYSLLVRGIELDVAVQDRIDEIIAPGVIVNPADNGDGQHDLPPALRRR